jgi:streptogramin lyase
MDNMVFSGEAVWIGSVDGRILQVHPDQPDLTIGWDEDDRGNSFGRIHELFKDREGNIWILASGGLFRSTGTRIQILSGSGHPSIHDVHSLFIDSEEDLVYCNDEGVFRYDFPSRSSKNIFRNDHNNTIHFMCLEEDPYGYIWAGTFDHGLFRIDPSSGRYRQITEKDGLVNDNVLSISNHNDTLWTATLGGASRLVLGGPDLQSDITITSFNQDNGLVNTFIYDVYEDKLNRIWFATDGDGICMLTDESFTYFDEEDGLGDDVIYSVTGDNEGNIWFSTSSDGVYRYDGRRFSHFGVAEGLRSLEISSLAVLGNEVVVVHGLGIDVIHLPDMLITSYGRESGLTEITPELNSIYANTRGNFWIGTKTGIIRYQRGSDDIVFSPRTIIEKMSVFMQPVKMSDNLALKAKQDHVSFQYSGIWLSDPEKVVYSVFLEGYDLDWKETYDLSATFSSLRPGNYTFHVRSSLDGSFARYSEASYSFSIKRPVWTTPWFIIVMASLLALFIYLIIKNREKKLKAIEQEKKEKVEFEFQLLKNQVNPHFLFDSFSTLISLIEEDDKMAREYTERLSDFFRRVLQLKENEVIPLAEELELIEDYLFIQQKRYGVMIKMDNQLKGSVLQSYIPPMTLQILMENAVKHNIISREQNLFIKIYQEDNYLIVENSFQPKRKTEESTGIGLENISKRYRLLTEKDIVISQTENLFSVKLPVI